MKFVNVVVEGETDIPVAEKVISFFGFEIFQTIVTNGKSRLDRRIPEFYRSGKHANWLIMRDLDHDAPCALDLINNIRKNLNFDLSQRVSLRIPVRTMESWLLADRESFCAAFSVRNAYLVENPDDLDDPASFLVATCRRSWSREIRSGMVPPAWSNRKVGLEYVTRVQRFAREIWNPERAARRSPSLRRTLARIQALVDDGIWF